MAPPQLAPWSCGGVSPPSRAKPGAAPSARGRGTASFGPPPSPPLRGGRRSPSPFAPRGAGGISLLFTLLPRSPGPSRWSPEQCLPGTPGLAQEHHLPAPQFLGAAPPPPPLPSFRLGFHFLTCPPRRVSSLFLQLRSFPFPPEQPLSLVFSALKVPGLLIFSVLMIFRVEQS